MNLKYFNFKRDLYLFLFIVLFSFCIFSVYAGDFGNILGTAQGTNYSLNLYTLGTAASKVQGSSYSARTLMTGFQSGTRNARGSVYFGNIGFFQNTSTLGALNFSINSYLISPTSAVKNSEIRLFVYSILASSVWAAIVMPNSSSQNITLINNDYVAYANTSLVGKYNVTFYASNFSGSIVNATSYFDITQTTQVVTSNYTYAGSSYECSKDGDCEVGKSCWNHKCVKLFDIKILSVESPIKPGGFFWFTYYLKGMADIKGDVIIEFWLEKDNQRFTSGQDTIYLGSFEEKTEKAQLYLPNPTITGVYYFYIKVHYGNYSAVSYRVIEVTEKGEIRMLPEEVPLENYNFYIGSIIASLIFIILVLGYIIYKMYQKRKSYVYNPYIEDKSYSEDKDFVKEFSI